MKELKTVKVSDMEKNILRISTELFLKQGYDKTTIRQIADCCGIGRGHLYYYFRKKEDILIHIFKKILTKIYSDVIENSDDKIEVLHSYALIQSVYTYTLALNENLLRIYLEGSNVDIIRRESQNILINLCQKKSTSSKYNVKEKDIKFSVIVGYAGECELLKRYYHKETDYDIDSIIRTIVSTRLLLLNIIDVKQVNQIVDLAIQDSKSYRFDDVMEKLHYFDF